MLRDVARQLRDDYFNQGRRQTLLELLALRFPETELEWEPLLEHLSVEQLQQAQAQFLQTDDPQQFYDWIRQL